MSNQYADTFDQRGHPYDQAMQQFPDSRNNEFIHLFEHTDWKKTKSLLDVPSGGGYIKRFIPDHCTLDSVDPSTPFRTSEAIYTVDLESLTLPECRYDQVISLAALHHIDNKSGFLHSVVHALKPGGIICFADVAKESGISRFLDDFAGQFNTTGHCGNYLEVDEPYPGFTLHENLSLIEHTVKPCPWVFDQITDMVNFCRLLFGLNKVSNQSILDALDHYIGFSETSGTNGRPCVQLHWELLYITLQKNK